MFNSCEATFVLTFVLKNRKKFRPVSNYLSSGNLFSKVLVREVRRRRRRRQRGRRRERVAAGLTCLRVTQPAEYARL